MSVFKTRYAARILFLAIIFALAGMPVFDVDAKPKAKNYQRDEVAASVVVSNTIAPQAVTPQNQNIASQGGQSVARFFTINQVLAKHQGRIAASGSVRMAAVDPTTTTDAPPLTPSTPASSEEPFGLFTFRAPEGALWVKWRAVETAMRAEAEVIERCRADSESCSLAAVRFLALVDAARGQKDRARLETVNRGINAELKYVSDMAQHGVPDLWSTPLASFASGHGDCEDYVIAKYVALRETGVAEDDLRLLLVNDTVSRQDHAVLAARHAGRWLVLDNRWEAMMETRELARFRPLFAIDHRSVKLFAAPYASRRGDGREDFAHWTLRGAEFPEWTLRGSADAIAPAANGYADGNNNEAAITP